MKIRLASPLQSDSIVDGEGMRMVVWTQGCSHNCKGCHNPETHAYDKGIDMDVEDVKAKIARAKNQDGVTLSGGDPFFQIEPSNEIAKFCKSNNLNVWAYTGFTFEKLADMAKTKPELKDFMENIDVLVDGKFMIEEKSMNLMFRGSKNQRVLDMKKSLELGYPIEIEKYMGEKTWIGYNSEDKEKECMFI